MGFRVLAIAVNLPLPSLSYSCQRQVCKKLWAGKGLFSVVKKIFAVWGSGFGVPLPVSVVDAATEWLKIAPRKPNIRRPLTPETIKKSPSSLRDRVGASFLHTIETKKRYGIREPPCCKP